MATVACSACGREVELAPGEAEVECPGCASPVVRPKAERGERGSRRRREFDPKRDINRMWCPECRTEVTASRINEERFNTVLGLGGVLSLAVGAGVAWPFLARGADWELVGILFALFLGIAIYVCAVIADVVSRGSVFRCKTCETETDPI
jgi:DNA-directed RNA polymerase subunit RPC12/RpoP